MTSNYTYACINTNSAFVRPKHPVPLAQIQNTTQYQTGETVRLHTKSLHIFNLCDLFKCTIIHQINVAVDTKLFTDLIDKETGFLQGTAPKILENLFETDGNITSQTLVDKKIQRRRHPLRPKDTPHPLFRSID